MGRIALKIPLSGFALGGRGQRHNLADARVQSLGHTLDHAALAGGVTALEQHYQFEFLMHNPVLQPDRFPLQPQQFSEIRVAIDGLFRLSFDDVL